MPFDFSCPDWADRLRDGRTPIADLPLDDRAADQAVAVFNNLRVPDVQGQPLFGDAFGEWIRDIVRAVFGSMSTSASVPEARQVGEVFVLVPKKNGKTTSAAALGITFLLLNLRPKADCLIVGPTQKISDTAFQQAAGIIDADPWLSKRFHVQAHKNQILDRKNKSRLMVRTFGMDVLTGCKPIFCLIDELHVLGQNAHAADVIRQIRLGMTPFPDALLVMITTQSDKPPAGIFKSELDYARAVRDGRIKVGVKLLPVLYEFPVEMQIRPGEDRDAPWLDPETWFMVQPQLGRQITIDRLLEGLQRAEHDGEHEVIAWATQMLNVEVGIAIGGDAWSGAQHWTKCGDSDMTLDRLLAECEVAVIGVDWGGADDLAALTIMGRRAKDRKYLHWARAWARPTVFEQRKSIASRLRDLEAAGDLQVVATPEEQADAAAAICARVRDLGLLPEEAGIGLDAAGVALLLDSLEAVGIEQPLVQAVPQGWKLQQAIISLPLQLEARKIVHCDQPLMAWSVSNAKQELRGSNYTVTKQASGAAKIDPLMATFNATMLMLRHPVAARPPAIPNIRFA